MKRMLWRLDARGIRVVWTWTASGVECRALGADETVGHGKTGVEALRDMLRRT
jgi:hypothetical protein